MVSEIVLELKDVAAYYRQLTPVGLKVIRAVDGVSLNVHVGEILGVIGESGSGKSTMANVMMMNVRKPLEFIRGSVRLYTEKGVLNLESMRLDELRKRVWGSEIAMVPQASMNALMPTIRIRKLIMDVFESHFDEVDEEEVIKIAMKRFEELGLPPWAVHRYPFELSGGMRQRAVLAVATLLNPRLLIADEPTSALDVVTQKMVLKTLKSLLSLGIVKSIVFISHDIATVRQIATRIAVMYAGKIVEEGEVNEIISNPLHPYTQGLIESIATAEPEIRKRGLKYIPGAPPDLSQPLPGCRFHPRCPFAMEICRKEEPPLSEVKPGRPVACWLHIRR
ncbi:MAG: ABC transporter ATP-binding protein [Sulfolobales archaeon]